MHEPEAMRAKGEEYSTLSCFFFTFCQCLQFKSAQASMHQGSFRGQRYGYE